jgi:hypothetical protein
MMLSPLRVHPEVHCEATDPACEVSSAMSGSDHSRKSLATLWPDQIERELTFSAARDRALKLLFVGSENTDALSPAGDRYVPLLCV